MSKIKPFWRVVLGFLILMAVVASSNELSFGGSFLGFAVSVAGLIVYIYFAIRVPYDDPLRSMRDLMAQQAEQTEAQKKAAVSDQERLAALEAELAELRQQLRDREK